MFKSQCQFWLVPITPQAKPEFRYWISKFRCEYQMQHLQFSKQKYWCWCKGQNYTHKYHLGIQTAFSTFHNTSLKIWKKERLYRKLFSICSRGSMPSLKHQTLKYQRCCKMTYFILSLELSLNLY